MPFLLAVLRFEQSEYYVLESQRSVTIRILVNFPATMEVTFLLEAKDITAKSENYSSVLPVILQANLIIIIILDINTI